MMLIYIPRLEDIHGRMGNLLMATSQRIMILLLSLDTYYYLLSERPHLFINSLARFQEHGRRHIKNGKSSGPQAVVLK